MIKEIAFLVLLLFLAVYLVYLYMRCSSVSTRYMKKMQEDKMQIIQLEKMASLGTLSAGIAHEINNPLTFVITNLDLISGYVGKMDELRDLDDTRKKVADIKECVQECADGAARIKRIVQDLLAFSHTSQGKINCVDINELLDRTVRILWNEIKYRADIVKDYKALTHIWVDSNQISQVFLNIIINASNAIKKNTASEKGKISIATAEDDKFITITIADTGCGIPERDLPCIFDPFFTTKEVGKGTGLGLSVSYGIIKKHGGRITVDSCEGKGCKFTVLIPTTPDMIND